MKWNPLKITALALAVLAAALMASRLRPTRNPAPDNDAPAHRASLPAPPHTRASQNPSTSRPSPQPNPTEQPVDPAQLIQDCLAALHSTRDPSEAGRIIARLRAAIRSQKDESRTATAIADFLRNGLDAPTGRPFIVGPDGMMSEVPSLRTALLDLLPTLDPALALEIARSIIRQRSSPDEYALALRNLAWNDHQGDLAPELTQAFNRMLEHPAWIEQPSAGFLEAFDVALQVPSPTLFSRISQIAASRPPGPADPLLHATCMTLDRLVLRQPGLLTTAWNQDPGWLATAPQQRASLMSRLDLSRTDHRSLFIRYLADPGIPASERELFTELFPNGNYLHGHRLVSTQETTPDIAQRQEMDRQTLAALDTLTPSAPPQAHAAIARIRSRLSAHVQSPPEEP